MKNTIIAIIATVVLALNVSMISADYR